MHIISAWTIAFSFLTMATNFCSTEDVLEPTAISDYESTKFANIIPMNSGNYAGKYSNIPGKPKAPPDSLPPKLTPSLNLESISVIWRAESAAVPSQPVSCDANKLPPKRCLFSWISGLSQIQKEPKYIEEIFNARTKQNSGWKLIDENGKMGYMPEKLGDKMVLEFSDHVQPIRSVTFFIMKSYGEKWEGSAALATVSAWSKKNTGWDEVSTLNMSGIHAKNTSEMYPETMTLPHPIQPESSLQVTYELTGGTTFKIMGLAVCS